MPDIFQTLNDRKEAIGTALGIAASAFGIIKTAYDVIQARSVASTRDKLLLRIEGLAAARNAIRSGSAGDIETSGNTLDLVTLQLSDALGQFAGFSKFSKKVEEKQALQVGLGLFQRIFLLYKPPNARAWIPHIFCWIISVWLTFLFIGTWFPDNGDASWSAFAGNWKQSYIYLPFLFLLGAFLLFRLWGVSERSKAVKQGKEIVARQKGVNLWSVIAAFYGVCGMGCFAAGVTLVVSDVGAGVKFGIMAVIVAGCGLTLYVWGKLRDGSASLPRIKALLAFSAPILLALVVIFNPYGIMALPFRHNLRGYWLSWIHEPVVPLLSVPFAAMPVYAAARSIRLMRSSLRSDR